MTELAVASQCVPLRGRAWTVAALVWLAVVLAVAAHQWRFWHADRLDADLMSLLPAHEQAPEVDLATRKLTDAAARRIVVMLGAPTWQQARDAAAIWRSALLAQAVPLKEGRLATDATLDQALAFYRSRRDRLLTPSQRETLGEADATLLARSALAALYRPGAQPRLSEWSADPLGLWPQWWSARAAETRVRPRDGELWLLAGQREWVVLNYEIAGAPLRLDGKAVFGGALRSAEAAVRSTLPDAQVLAAGMPLHAEAAAVQASREANTIGWGSLAAVLVLVWLAFRSIRAIALIGLSLVVGTAAALSATAAVFGQVHLMTLVFGASLVGVAEDYGIHYFAARQGRPWAQPRGLMRQLLPGLALALLTSVLAYLTLGTAPFPGLRQMALFSAVGLVAAFATVACWFPLIDRGPVSTSRFAAVVGASLERWPRLASSRRAWAAYATVAVLCLAGLSRLHVDDDVRQLRNSPTELMQQQHQVSELLGLPSAAQFYVVRAGSAEAVLQQEEALTRRLDVLVAGGRIAGYSAVSDWVPSAARQRADAALTARVEHQVLAAARAALGEAMTRPGFAASPLALEEWLASPVSAGARALWLGEVAGAQTSVVMLRGLHDAALLPALAGAAQGLDGVRWVDKPSEISQLLGRYRAVIGYLLVVGHGLVFAALWWRFGRLAWRAWLPTALATGLTLAFLGLLGQPFQLFNVLALLLLLGVGVDYGIFLLEHRNDGSAWLAVALGATSTWLAFGLLALSATPSLQAFGLTLLIGLALVSLLAPCCRAGPPHCEPGSRPSRSSP